jgi:lipoprotein-anchoring transpeptidase ErfK/SrfK
MTKVLTHALILLSLSAVHVRAQQVEYVIHTRSAADKSAPSPLDALTPEQIAVVEKLNRVDATRLKRQSTVVIPASWMDDENAYSPFPQEWSWALDQPKAIVVDQAAQAFAAYEYGRLVRWGPVSTGSDGQTPSGLFHLSWRSRGHRSSVDPSWYLEWYFNFIPSRGIAFHKYSLPGQAASHGCVRMLERDSQWLFEWGDAPKRGVKGTPVVVLGCPDRAKQWHAADFLEQGISLPDAPPGSVMNCQSYAGSTPAAARKTIR